MIIGDRSHELSAAEGCQLHDRIYAVRFLLRQRIGDGDILLDRPQVSCAVFDEIFQDICAVWHLRRIKGAYGRKTYIGKNNGSGICRIDDRPVFRCVEFHGAFRDGIGSILAGDLSGDQHRILQMLQFVVSRHIRHTDAPGRKLRILCKEKHILAFVSCGVCDAHVKIIGAVLRLRI